MQDKNTPGALTRREFAEMVQEFSEASEWMPEQLRLKSDKRATQPNTIRIVSTKCTTSYPTQTPPDNVKAPGLPQNGGRGLKQEHAHR